MKKLLIASTIVFSVILVAGFISAQQANAATITYPWTGTGTFYFVDITGTVTATTAATITINQAVGVSGEPKDFSKAEFFGTISYTLDNVTTTVDFTAVFSNVGNFSLNGITTATPSENVLAELSVQSRRNPAASNKLQTSLVISGSIPGSTSAWSFIGAFFKSS